MRDVADFFQWELRGVTLSYVLTSLIIFQPGLTFEEHFTLDADWMVIA